MRTPHEGHGPQIPTSAVPARRDGSVRRTSTLDSRWPDGLGGGVALSARGRDLRTDVHSATSTITSMDLTGDIDFHNGRAVTAITSTPSRPELATLVGAAAAAGFRGKARAALPADRAERSLLHLLLDDIPVAILVAAFAFNAARSRLGADGRKQNYVVDQCSGWADGATMMTAVRKTGWSPQITGPLAPDLRDPRDSVAWHENPPMQPVSTRRERLLDLWQPEPAAYEFWAIFRDTYMDEVGEVSVVHEYEVTGRLADDLTIADLVTTPHVLPWTECPMAALSGARLVGRPVSSLREGVRADLTGTSSCTHLNDLYRSLDDVVALQKLL